MLLRHGDPAQGGTLDPNGLAATALRAAAVYLILLLVVRLLGKRAVGNFSAFDLLVALMLGEVADEIIYGDVSFAQGLAAIGVIGVLQYLNSWLSYFDHGFDALLEGRPTAVVRDGRFVRDGLRAEHMNEKDVLSALRLQGVGDLAEVKLATVETDGEVSVLRQDWAEPLQKADYDAEAAAERERDLKAALGDRDTARPVPAER